MANMETKIAIAIKKYLIDLAVKGKLPSDLNLLSASKLEDVIVKTITKG